MHRCGTDMAPLGVHAMVAGMASTMLLLSRPCHFLYCLLRPENSVPSHGQNLPRSALGDSAVADQDATEAF